MQQTQVQTGSVEAVRRSDALPRRIPLCVSQHKHILSMWGPCLLWHVWSVPLRQGLRRRIPYGKCEEPSPSLFSPSAGCLSACLGGSRAERRIARCGFFRLGFLPPPPLLSSTFVCSDSNLSAHWNLSSFSVSVFPHFSYLLIYVNLVCVQELFTLFTLEHLTLDI